MTSLHGSWSDQDPTARHYVWTS